MFLKLIKSLLFFVFAGVLFLNIQKTFAFESRDVVDARINSYCTERLGINRADYSYTGTHPEFFTGTFTEMQNRYHQDINQLFNDSIQKIVKYLEQDQTLQQTCSNTLLSRKIQSAFSSYEISQKALCRFAVYQMALKDKKQQVNANLNDPDLQEILLEKTGKPETSLQVETFQAVALYQEKLDQELLTSKGALQSAIKAYDEMLLMYPLHIRLRCIISDLLDYRAQLSKLVDVFFCMDRYINASSDKVN